MNRLWAGASAVFCLAATAFAQTPPMSVSCIGQWYNVEDKTGAIWLSYRICRVNQNALLTISDSSGAKRQFHVPFSSKSDSGPNWQRLNREAYGCDVVLVKTLIKKGTRSADWTLNAATGDRLLHGQVSIVAKGHPFSMPSPLGKVVGKLRKPVLHEGTKPRK